MNNMVAVRGAFDAGRLNKAHYTVSLASEALRCGECSERQYDELQMQLNQKLAENILLYTNGLSSSVENRIALRILASMLYNTDIALLRIPADEAMRRLFSEPIDVILRDGMKLNREYTLKALSKLRAAERVRIESMCVSYNRLYSGTLHELIRANDIRFDAARCLVLTDYPMPTVNRSAKGICGMLHLLDELTTENQFVNTFDSTMREMLFERWLRELVNTTSAGINLGELCFEQAMLCIMAGKPAGDLLLTKDDCRILAMLYTADIAYENAVSLVHKLADRAPERYLMKLLSKFRVALTMIFEGGLDSIRRFSGIKR